MTWRYWIAIQLMIYNSPVVEVDWRQAEGILFTWNEKYFAVCCGFQMCDSFQLLFSYWELSSIWWTFIMSGFFLLWHMVCNIFFWLDFYLFQFALERCLCLGTRHFQYNLKEIHQRRMNVALRHLWSSVILMDVIWLTKNVMYWYTGYFKNCW